MLKKLEGQVAALIMEPAMMNINIIPPADGYLARVRELTAAHGVKLIFDEVKTGCTIAYGGATERFGVEADLVTLAKATFRVSRRRRRDDRGARGADRGRRVPPIRDLQRKPTGDGGFADGADRGSDRRRVREARAHEPEAGLGSQEIIDRYNLPAYPEGMGAKAA